MALFKRAERKKAWLKLALTGPSGSGKTYSALLIAKGMGKRIAVIDTENESAALYAGIPGLPDFDHCSIDPPYTIDKYTAAIQAALTEGYDVLVIDSLSHAWAGEGGLLQQKEDLDSRGGKGEKNKFTNWGAITKQQERFKGWLLKADVHMIVTMRSKQDYVLGEGNAPIKVGMAPIQREGMEYEFTMVLDMAMNHSAKTSKDRTGLFDGKIFVPNEKTGLELINWLNLGSGELSRRSPEELKEVTKPDGADSGNNNSNNTGSAPSEKKPPVRTQGPSDAQLKRLFAIAHEHGWSNDAVKSHIRDKYKAESSKTLSQSEYDELCRHLETQKPGSN